MTEEKPRDLVVIGGGIVGCGIALDATLRGLQVLLLEQGELGSGTSSRSSKLIHGGIRYLEQYQWRLVFEACRERRLLLKNAPGLVWPLTLLLPVYQENRRSRFRLSLGLWLYDLLAMFRNVGRHRSLSREKIQETLSGLRGDGLTGGFLFHDAQMDDARLVREVAEAAGKEGAEIREGVAAIGFTYREGKISGVKINGGSIPTRQVMNAAGPWVDKIRLLDDPKAHPLLRPSKGVHLLFDPSVFAVPHGLLLFAPQDQRVFFILPWQGKTLVGTTDTDFQGDPGQARVEEADIQYLLDAVNHYFPELSLAENHITGRYAGIRPLVKETADSPSGVSREHVIQESPSGMLTIAGGKYTTFRQMAEDAVDRILLRLGDRARPCQTRTFPISAP